MAKEYNISKTSGQCATCKTPILPEEELMAVIRETDEAFIREDFCLNCWPSQPQEQDSSVLGVWRARVPKPEEKKKLLVDDEVLVNFFHRLEGTEEQAKINFRFVLALVLMRKRLLIYDRMNKDAQGNQTWQMHIRGNSQVHHVIDPDMDEDKIAQVSQQLGQIMEGEL